MKRIGTEVVAVGAAAVGLWSAGLLVAAPTGVGLGLLAASDASTHRISLRVLRSAAVLGVVALVIDISNGLEWARVGGAAAATGLVAVVVGSLWLATPGIAFGDVLLTIFATFVPALASPGAVAVMLLAAVLASAALMVGSRFRSAQPDQLERTVAFGPPLLVGWLLTVGLG